MGNINRCTLSGRLTKDPEIKKTQTGLSVCSFSIAVNRYAKQGEPQQADFINCIAWRGTADYLGQYGKKGQQITISGRLQTRQYDRNDGSKATVTEVLVDDIDLAYTKSNSNSDGGYMVTGGNSYYTNPKNEKQKAANASFSDELSSDEFANDLPF